MTALGGKPSGIERARPDAGPSWRSEFDQFVSLPAGASLGGRSCLDSGDGQGMLKSGLEMFAVEHVGARAT